MSNGVERFLNVDDAEGLNKGMPLQAEPHELSTTQRSLHVDTESRERPRRNTLEHSRGPGVENDIKSSQWRSDSQRAIVSIPSSQQGRSSQHCGTTNPES